MKQLYFVIFTTFLFTETLLAQEPDAKFVNEKNRWHLESGGIDFGSGEVSRSLSRYVFRDTAHISGRVYHKLYRSHESNYDNFEFQGYYREDSLGNIYVLGQSNDIPAVVKDYLLYTFDVNVGDTIQLEPNDDPYDDLKVIAIDSITLNSGQKRKRIKLNFLGNREAYWIEGIGSTFATMDTRLMGISDGWINLACYQYEGEIEYETGACNLRTSTREPQSLHFAKIFPNPFTNFITIQTKQPGLYTVQLFDHVGRLLWQQPLTDNDLNVNSLQAGAHYRLFLEKMVNFKMEKLINIK